MPLESSVPFWPVTYYFILNDTSFKMLGLFNHFFTFYYIGLPVYSHFTDLFFLIEVSLIFLILLNFIKSSMFHTCLKVDMYNA